MMTRSLWTIALVLLLAADSQIATASQAQVMALGTLPVEFQLQDASGQPISDTETQSLVSPSWRIARRAERCPATYSSTSKPFQFNLKTTNAMKGPNGVSITVTVGGALVAASRVGPLTVK